MPTDTPYVYVFICGDPEVRGLTLQRSGENLPCPLNNSTWTPIAIAPLTLDELKRHALDPALAFLNLQTKGFHIGRIAAQVIPFPQANRHSA